jgi:hypothetical protein
MQNPEAAILTIKINPSRFSYPDNQQTMKILAKVTTETSFILSPSQLKFLPQISSSLEFSLQNSSLYIKPLPEPSYEYPILLLVIPQSLSDSDEYRFANDDSLSIISCSSTLNFILNNEEFAISESCYNFSSFSMTKEGKFWMIYPKVFPFFQLIYSASFIPPKSSFNWLNTQFSISYYISP